MKFRFTISGTYEANYPEGFPGTAAEIETQKLKDDPDLFLEDATEFKVEPDLQSLAEEGYKEVTQ